VVFKLHNWFNIKLNWYNNKFVIKYIHTDSVHRQYVNVQRVSDNSDLMIVTNVNYQRYPLKSKSVKSR